MTDFQRVVIPSKISSLTSSEDSQNNSPLTYVPSEKKGINLLRNKLLEIIYCCNPSKQDTICTCLLPEDELHSFLTNNGFGYAVLDEIEMYSDSIVTLKNSTLEDRTNCKSITYKGIHSDIFSETLTKLNDLKARGQNVKGYIIDSQDCNLDMISILNDIHTRDFGIIHYLYIREPGVTSPSEEKFELIYTYIWDPLRCVKGTSTTELSSPPNHNFTINGLEGSYVKMNLPIGINVELPAAVDFGGNYENIEGSRIAVGYQISGNGSWAFGIGPQFSIGDTWLIFTSGDYKLYPYEYVYHEELLAIGFDTGIDASLEGIVAWNVWDDDLTLVPDSLQGAYELITMSGSSGSFEAIGGTYQLNIPYCWLEEPPRLCNAWFSASFGITYGSNLFPVDISVGTSLFDNAVRRGRYNDLGGNARLLTPTIKSKNRTLLDWMIQYARFFKLVTIPIEGSYITIAYEKAAEYFNK